MGLKEYIKCVLTDIVNSVDKSNKVSPTKVMVEFDVNDDEFIKMGIKDKIIQVLNK